MVKLIERCSFLCRHWMSYLWMLKQLRRVTVLVLIRQGCQGYMDCQHHRCILQAVLVIRIQRLQKTQSHESLLTQGSFSNHFMVMQILMEVDARTCQVSIRQWIHKAFECAVYWSISFFFFFDIVLVHILLAITRHIFIWLPCPTLEMVGIRPARAGSSGSWHFLLTRCVQSQILVLLSSLYLSVLFLQYYIGFNFIVYKGRKRITGSL